MFPPLNKHRLLIHTGSSLFHIVSAGTLCLAAELSLGLSAFVVFTTWLGLMAVLYSVLTLTFVGNAAAASHRKIDLAFRGMLLRNEVLSSPRYDSVTRLNRFEAKVYSQNGEDGVISEIFRRIGTTNQFFVEFGSSNGWQNNTVLLLRQGWSGQWVEGDPKLVEDGRRIFAKEIEGQRLVITHATITAENAEEIIRKGGAPEEPDLLSIDVDRNDYYVWDAIRAYRPRAVVVEYNAIFPPEIDWVVEYDAGKWWDGTSQFGASLKALERLGREKGYCLVGCELSGANAFFVRSDLAGDLFEAPFTAVNHYEPPRYHLKDAWGGHRRRP